MVKFFICALEEMVLGIPSKETARIIPAPHTQTTLYESEQEDLFFSLPVLFRKDSVPAPHGIVLKKKYNDLPNEKRLILLVPRIETDLDISEGEIRLLPALIREKLSCLGGACFNNGNLVLLLDTENLIKMIQGVCHD
jgi:hypothetical protein